MKKYSKSKAGPKKGPKYRTPSNFSPRKRFGKASSSRFGQGGEGIGSLATHSSKFSGKGNLPQAKFSPSTFKVQHKG